VIIGPGATVRHCALIRENVLLGEGVNVGHCTGVKNSILFDEVQVPHYNYVGDSILGSHVHMGAGSVVSNLKGDGSNVCLRRGEEKVETGRRKLGALIGDGVEIGCGCILNPGTVIGRGSRIYPGEVIRGTLPAGHLCKTGGEIVPLR
jgi:NDP-sugar pyrophosphorylase family protein